MISNFQSILEVTLICLGIMALALFPQGCGVQGYSASTTAVYKVAPDGTKEISYTSNKEQQGLDLDLTEVDGKPTGVKIHVDKASTSEQAIAAAVAVQLKLIDMIQRMLDAGAAAGKTGS